MMAKKEWVLGKHNEGVVRGVYLRDLPLLLASAVKEECCDWWAEHEGNVLCFTLGVLMTITAFLWWG